MGQGAMGRCMIFCLLLSIADPPCTLQKDMNSLFFAGRAATARCKHVSSRAHAAPANGHRELASVIEDLTMHCMRSCCARGLPECVALHAGSDADEIRIKEENTAMLRCTLFSSSCCEWEVHLSRSFTCRL